MLFISLYQQERGCNRTALSIIYHLKMPNESQQSAEENRVETTTHSKLQSVRDTMVLQIYIN